ncbi:GTPase Era [Marinicellulosiphila megalodicopiae]|uniref:GTPase Era n=1 Tax=Marinicellulosiphila megalodicopiae TaxID=2724896 RepID=UPI003BB041E3
MNEFQLTTQCGFVAIVGRPNVGKSTLLNKILGQKISITSRKPQTTRQQIVGIDTIDDIQAIFVDTPGLHLHQEKAINQYMNRAASSALVDVDAVVFIVDKMIWNEEDEFVLQKLKNVKCPVYLAINKIDQINDKEKLLPHIEMISKKHDFDAVFPMCALKGGNVEELLTVVRKVLPKGLFHYSDDQITDRTERFLAAEIVREKIMRQLGDEIPYEIAVEIEKFSFENRILHIHALILVERDGQKRIVIGDKGSRLKLIGSEARKDMEAMFECQVMLHTWVKVKNGWSDDERALRSLGYTDD